MHRAMRSGVEPLQGLPALPNTLFAHAVAQLPIDLPAFPFMQKPDFGRIYEALWQLN